MQKNKTFHQTLRSDENKEEWSDFYYSAPDDERAFVKIVLTTFIFFTLFYCVNSLYEVFSQYIQAANSTNRQLQSEVIKTMSEEVESHKLPSRLKIPKINLDATVEYVGRNSNGEMEVPGNIADVGWLKFGPYPGKTGSAVIAGHLNGVGGTPGVFSQLKKLQVGDKLHIEDSDGVLTSFSVKEVKTLESGFTEDVFSKSDGVHLNLIASDGAFDASEKGYNERIIVFADIAQ